MANEQQLGFDDSTALLPSPSSPSDFRLLFYKAIQFDRTVQWHALVEQCQHDHDTLFLLHAPLRQCVWLFLDRVQSDLGKDARIREAGGLRIERVPLQAHGGDPGPATGNDWLRLVAEHLSVGYLKPMQALSEAAKAQPLLVLIEPVPSERLEIEQIEGIEHLVADFGSWMDRLPARRPIRCLLAIDYPGDAVPPWLDQLRTQTRFWPQRRASRSSSAVFEELTPLHMPPWDELKTFLRNHHVPEARLIGMRQTYDRICRDSFQTFRNLLDFIERELIWKAP